MSARTAGASNELSSFFLVERFNEAMNTQNNDSLSLDCLVKKIASIALLIIVPLNILLLPFIGIWNCFFATKATITHVPPVQIPASGSDNPTQNVRFEPYSKIRDDKLVAFKMMGANTLAGMDSPFEFSGELCLGEKADQTRDRVWGQITSMASFYKNCPDEAIQDAADPVGSAPADLNAKRTALIKAAINAEKTYGPTFGELITPEFIVSLRAHFPGETAEIDAFVVWVNKFKDVRAFPLLRGFPDKLIGFDKLVNDTIGENRVGSPPTLFSTVPVSENSEQAIGQLLGYLAQFPVEMKDAKLAEVQQKVAEFDEAKLKKLLEDTAVSEDLSIFTRTKFGQKLFYAIYHEENRRLVADAPQVEGETTTLLQDANLLKQLFAQTLSDPQTRANVYIENIKKHEFGVVFTQEAYQQIIDGLAPNFLPIDRQVDAAVGRDCLIFLHKDMWEEEYKVVSFAGKYADKDRKHLVMVLAQAKQTGEWFAFASGHGDAGNAKDARVQLELIKAAFDDLDREQYPDIQLVIQTDANTKKPEDVDAFKEKGNELNFKYSKMLETCFKQRMATVMNGKVGIFDRNPGDVFLVLCSEVGGLFHMTHLKIGYKKEQSGDSKLPNLKYPSDHYPVSVKLKRYTEAELERHRGIKRLVDEILAESTTEENGVAVPTADERSILVAAPTVMTPA